MMRSLMGVVVVLTAGFVLVGQSVGQDDEKKPSYFGVIKEVKKAEEGKKGLGTLVILAGKKDDRTEKTVKLRKNTEIMKRTGKDSPPEKASFDDLKEGQFVAVWLVEGKEDVAKKITFGMRKKKKADN